MDPAELIFNDIIGLKRKIFKKHPYEEGFVLKKEIKNYDELENIINTSIQKTSSSFKEYVEFSLSESEKPDYKKVFKAYKSQLKDFKKKKCKKDVNAAITKDLPISKDSLRADFSIYKKQSSSLENGAVINFHLFIPDMIPEIFLPDTYFYALYYFNLKASLDGLEKIRISEMQKLSNASTQKKISNTTNIQNFNDNRIINNDFESPSTKKTAQKTAKNSTYKWVWQHKYFTPTILYKRLKEKKLIEENTKIGDFKKLFDGISFNSKQPPFELKWGRTKRLLIYLLEKLKYGKYIESTDNEWVVIESIFKINNLKQAKYQLYKNAKNIKDTEKKFLSIEKPKGYNLIDEIIK